MFNHHRGLWGYSGPAHADGQQLLIQSTGMGGPSATIVFEELIALGVRRAIRVGTCGALDPHLSLGDLVLATEAICEDGTSRALSGKERVRADAGLTTLLQQSAEPRRSGAIVTTDLFYDRRGHEGRWQASGALAVEMEAAALFALGASREVAVACLLAVSDVFPAPGARNRVGDEDLLAVAERMGAAAVAALPG